MSRKPQQQPHYRQIPQLLRALREQAGLTQRALGAKLKKPQSWIYNCETANRRVDLMEFVLWTRACDEDPVKTLSRFLSRSA